MTATDHNLATAQAKSNTTGAAFTEGDMESVQTEHAQISLNRRHDTRNPHYQKPATTPATAPSPADGSIVGFLFPSDQQRDAEAHRVWLATQHPGLVENHATGPFFKQQLIKLTHLAIYFWRFCLRKAFFQLIAHALTRNQFDFRNVEYFLKRLVHGRTAYKGQHVGEEMPRDADYGDRVLCRLVDRLQTLWLIDEDGYQGRKMDRDKRGEEEFENENEALTAYLYTMDNFVQADSTALLNGLPEPPRQPERFMRSGKRLSERRTRSPQLFNNLAVRVKVEPPSTPERESQQAQDLQEISEKQTCLEPARQKTAHSAAIKDDEIRGAMADDKEELDQAMLLLAQSVALVQQSATRFDLDQEARLARNSLATELTKALSEVGLLVRK